MSPHLLSTLEKIGRDLVRSRASLKATWGAAFIGIWIFLHGLIDLWLRLDRSNRLATWTILLALVAGTVWFVWNALRQRFTPEGIAASLEKTFPELDNRLINFLQLSRNPERDLFKDAYVRAGVPKWQGLDLKQMRDLKAQKRSRIFLGTILVVLILPTLIFGKAWPVAIWRTINPVTNIVPPSLTSILKVEPGTATVLQGTSLDLACTVKGFPGHRVQIDIEPADGTKSAYSLGEIDGSAEKVFTHSIPKVNTNFRYRFRAGDAPVSTWFTIGTRPPPAFTDLKITVDCPPYMKRTPRVFNPRTERLLVPVGSELKFSAMSNVPLQSVLLIGAGDPHKMSHAGDQKAWSATASFTTGNVLRLAAVDGVGTDLQEDIPVTMDPDKAPKVQIVSPTGRTILQPAGNPQITFRISDDFGISKIQLEEVLPDATAETKGTVVEIWDAKGERSFEQVWKSTSTPASGQEVAYRVVAIDNLPDKPNRTLSSTIAFKAPSAEELSKQRQELEKTSATSLDNLLELQKRNITETERLLSNLSNSTPQQWNECAKRQEQIRGLMRDLLANPLEPLGGLTAAAKKLYINEMVLAMDSLKSIPAAEGARKAKLAKEALELQNKILRQLSFAPDAIEQAKIERSVSGLTAMLESLVREQNGALEQTRPLMEKQVKVPANLVRIQDKLSEDMAAFITASKAEATQAAKSDVALADTLNKLSEKAKELKIREDMVLAAERLEQNKPSEAVPLQQKALANLKSLEGILEQVALKEEGEKRAAMLQAVASAKEKLEKLEAIHQKVLQSMEEVRGQKDKNDKETDGIEEEYAEIIKNTKEAMLEIPKDLHIFKDLNAANDLVEDIFSVFQEIEQQENKVDKEGKTEITEQNYAKEEQILEQMGEIKERLDATEMWLQDKADAIKVNTEAYDQKEMPESGLALGELAAAAQDLIGDLVKESENLAKDSGDSATNTALPDFAAGWDVAEGNVATFSAQGKSSNQAPDHKEQDGRSNVGRQGMSNGETASGSGTIGEGDKNIEARRTEDPTQSGQVDLKGKADTKATGGGKLATGKADSMGMGGGAERMDSKATASSAEMAALMAKRADTIYAKASMKNVRVDSLKTAAHHLRQSADAIAKGDIKQVSEFRNMANASLKRAHLQLQAGPSGGGMEAKQATKALDSMIESGPDMAPPQFREKVSEYYKALNEAL